MAIRKHDAENNADDLKLYTRTIALLGQMLREKAITQYEYDVLKTAYMADFNVISDFLVGRSSCFRSSERNQL